MGNQGNQSNNPFGLQSWEWAVAGALAFAIFQPFFDELFAEHSRNAAKVIKKRALKSS